MKIPSRFLLAGSLSLVLLPIASQADVVINEVMWDDTGAADDREFIELFNNGTLPVDISGWVITGHDLTTTNPSVTINAGTTLNPGSYYVLGNAGTLNINQTIVANFLENDNESLELFNGPAATGTLMDAIAYETNKGMNFPGLPAGFATQVGPTGIFANSQGSDLAGTPLNASVSIGRFVDGRDTGNNGRDFGLRPSTPGTTNAPGGFMTAYTPADPTPLAVGATPAGIVGSFVSPRVIDPTVADVNNPNAISAPNGVGSKAYVAWDSSGGGNGVTTTAVFNTKASSFNIRAYLDTTDLPVQSNNAVPPVEFKGSEITVYGIGSADALANLTDLTGNIGLSAVTLPATESANGTTGYAWIYERVGAPSGGGPVSELLHLVNANDGGDSDLGGNTPLDWTIITTIDLAATASGWHDLSISIDASGAGLASYDGSTFAFIADSGFHSGAFNVQYRENLQIGADLTPDALMRPPTYSIVPEPNLAALTIAGLMLGLRRKRK